METKEKRRLEQPEKAGGKAVSGRKSPTRKPAGRAAEGKKTRQPNQEKMRVPAGKAGSRGRSAVQTPSHRKPVPRRRRPAQKKPASDVVYVQPMPFNKSRFILCLLIVLAVVLAVIFGMSIFFKVDESKITVSGVEKYTEMQIREASGIQDGENLLSISEARISSNIIEELPYVNKVRVGIKLPDTVKIEIVELDVVYSVEAVDGSWWLVRSDGYVVEKTNSADAEQHTKILGVQLTEPIQGKEAAAYQPEREDAEGETLPITVFAEEQLQTALSIAQYLEDCGVVGQAKNIDVSNLAYLQLWYGDRYQVILGDNMELGRKIKSMKATIGQLKDYQSGVLDASFTTWPDQVGYTPFS